MRAMKDSGIEWIGQIPQDWQIAKVKHVYSFQTGWTPSTSNAAYFDGDLPWANISDIGKTKTIYDTAKHITEEAVANSSMGISPKGSLMYSFKLSVGDVSFCGTDMYTNEAIATFLPSDKYDLRYLYYAAPLFIIKNANENIYGAKLLNQELIRNALILNPPYNEQVSVANYLDAKCAEIDALIAAKEKTNALLKERRQSIIYEAVTKGLNPNAPMKDSGVEWIGEIPQEWYVDRLKYCANLDSEKLSEKTDPEYAFNYIDISSVTEYGGIGGTQEMTFEKSPSRARMVVHDGDTIISTVRTYLKAIAYIDGLEDHICSTGFCVVTPNEKLHPKFGYYLMQSDYFVQKIVSESVGVSYPAISSTEIGNMSIAIPVPEEQARIAYYLDTKCAEIDALISANEATIKKLKEYRQSIIYEAVTGKIEI